MSPEIAAFLLGYLLIMASPGPNMVAIGTVAALEGLACALPMVAGIASGVGGLASLVLAVGELMHLEALSPSLQFLAGAMLLAIAWTISRSRSFARTDGAGHPRRAGKGLAMFFAGFSTAASNPITIAYFAAALVPIGRTTAAEGGSSFGIVFAVAGSAALFWLACAALMARPSIRGVVERRERPIRIVAAILIASIALPMLLGALGVVPRAALPRPGLAGATQ
jgi:threonine/homoserine/homoserine lactone efflux protein